MNKKIFAFLLMSVAVFVQGAPQEKSVVNLAKLEFKVFEPEDTKGTIVDLRKACAAFIIEGRGFRCRVAGTDAEFKPASSEILQALEQASTPALEQTSTPGKEDDDEIIVYNRPCSRLTNFLQRAFAGKGSNNEKNVHNFFYAIEFCFYY